ncbi:MULTISPECIES: phosphoenolpyruvate carboxykinase (ATP) [unclassified Sphingobacterium]|uniref:phosphoenolpyruvate carboxykinase (ATP) n=1 Tax=unclassified Sphingobacterium TaxID=2609468 RepID=UPI0025FDF36F|nr:MULTISPECIES: phosphoenolpyruvate carboxykinase (ATP) [unclassified Sphingobacterium]
MATEKLVKLDLAYLNINNNNEVNYQLDVSTLVEQAIKNSEGTLSDTGALNARTGKFTGRSPKDRYIVKDQKTANHVWWGDINQPISEEAFEKLRVKVAEHLSAAPRIYVRDAVAGADPAYAISLRVITETAYQSIFANNLFIRPDVSDASVAPQWTILAAPSLDMESIEGYEIRNKNFVIIDFTRKMVLIAGTGYTGEIKKSIFSILNFILPLEHDVLSMHCSANKSKEGETSLFFGLSGTGKTTLSADRNRLLIGDDEHGWSADGVFNFEGGCYAKCIGLTADKEPEIFNAIQFGALLENVVYEPGSRTPDYENISITENIRVSYPISYMEGADLSGKGNTPKHIFFLTADAFGVLPPISLLNNEQAMYHFISGYTAKVAGTEVGVVEPTATFSACFGQAFLPLHPEQYAALLKAKLLSDPSIRVWLVNTGWIKGPYGVGHRIKLSYTRNLIRAAMSGELQDSDFNKHELFGLRYPVSCYGIPDDILNAKKLWKNDEAYDLQAAKLATLFMSNMNKYGVSEDILKGGPQVAVQKEEV